MRIVLPDANESVVFEKVSWRTFEQLLEELGDTRGRRVAYDRGRLEIMSPSGSHERIRLLICRMLTALTEELGIEIVGLGSTTFRRADLLRGIEPDACYYITNEARIRAVENVDLHRDPPPDLAIEVDVTKKSLDRFPIYAALGIPEVWRYSKGAIEIHLLRGGNYEDSATSPLFPGFPVAELARVLEHRSEMGDNQIVKIFRAWVREQSTAE